MASLAEIRARIAAQENKKQGQGSRGQSDNAIYPHWNIPENTTATVRFLPDKNNDNPWGFWVERQIVNLPFNGIKGDPNAKRVTVKVPCVEMYGDNCPILAEVRPWYKDKTLETMANSYWKKRTYLFQGFVRTNPLDEVAPANPIRRFIISPQIFPLIKAVLTDPEVMELPTDYVHGLDFHIKKVGKNGSKYADYTTSNWARRESPLTEAEQAAIDAHGLFNLSDFLPKKPSEAELRIIKEMFDASVDGKPYDTEKFGAYYRPYGVNANDNSDMAPSVASNSSPSLSVAEEDDVPFEPSTPSVPTSSVKSAQTNDILALIRSRQSKA